ncbi:hypothetical protein GCM10009554_37440 [Kribbella koreensis]|uniref:Uncharacterized protein n=1 Tax=Kribbella koreensis TaxID=57909 RepID=A0ABN1QKT1_9ACTN
MAVAAGLACLAAPLASQAATTAYPTAPFDVRYGNTYAVGTVTFFNRGVATDGTVKSVSLTDCRFIRVQALNPAGHQLSPDSVDDSNIACEGSVLATTNLPADVIGGAASVRVSLMAVDLHSGVEKFLVSQRVFPS